MTDGQEQTGTPPTASEKISEVNAEAAGAPVSVPVEPMTQARDQISQLMSHPRVKGYLGKSIKIVAGFAILGCLLLLAAVTALSNMIGNALPH